MVGLSSLSSCPQFGSSILKYCSEYRECSGSGFDRSGWFLCSSTLLAFAESRGDLVVPFARGRPPPSRPSRRERVANKSREMDMCKTTRPNTECYRAGWYRTNDVNKPLSLDFFFRVLGGTVFCWRTQAGRLTKMWRYFSLAVPGTVVLKFGGSLPAVLKNGGFLQRFPELNCQLRALYVWAKS